MATVAEVKTLLEKLDPNEHVLAVIVTRKEFNENIVADGPTAYTNSLWERYLEEYVDTDVFDERAIGGGFLDIEFCDMQPSSWSHFQEEYRLMYIDGSHEMREAYAQALIDSHDVHYAEQYAFDNTEEN